MASPGWGCGIINEGYVSLLSTVLLHSCADSQNEIYVSKERILQSTAAHSSAQQSMDGESMDSET